MLQNQVHIKCTKCGTFNTNPETCTECGAMLNIAKQREIARQNVEKKRIADDIAKEPSKVEKFIRKMMSHRWLVVRLFFQLIYGVWVVVMAIAMFIAWLVGFLVG